MENEKEKQNIIKIIWQLKHIQMLHPHTKNKGERKNLWNSKFLSIRAFIPSFPPLFLVPTFAFKHSAIQRNPSFFPLFTKQITNIYKTQQDKNQTTTHPPNKSSRPLGKEMTIHMN